MPFYACLQLTAAFLVVRLVANVTFKRWLKRWLMITNARDFKLAPKAGAKVGNLFWKGSVIWCRFVLVKDGRRRDVRRSTGKTVEREARQVAWRIFLEESGAGVKPVPKRRNVAPRLGALLDVLERDRLRCSGASAKSVRGYRRALELMVRMVIGAEADRVPVTVVNEDLVYRFREARYRAAGLDLNVDEDLALNVSLNSQVQDARACFSRKALRRFAELGFEVDVKAFLEVPKLREGSKRYVPIDREVDEAIRGEVARKLAGQVSQCPSVGVAVSVELARYVGLTAKEIAAVRWDWFGETARGECFVEVRARRAEENGGRAFTTKANSKNGRVPVARERVAAWRKALQGDGSVLPEARARLVVREASEWLAPFLPGRAKRLHELRKEAGSQVFSATGRIDAAAAFLRDSERVARDYYLADLHEAGALGAMPL